MRSIIATSALAAASGVIAPSTRPRRCDSATLRGEPVEQRAQRLDADRAEPPVALLRGEVARAEHRAVRVPVLDERVDELAGAASRPSAPDQSRASSSPTGARSSPTSSASDEHRLLDVAEVLVEGRRRRPDDAGDVDDAQVADTAVLEQPRGGVEQTSTGQRTALAECAPVERAACDRHGAPSSRTAD